MLRILTTLFVLAISTQSYGGSGPELVSAAKKQIGVTVSYDGRYQKIAYPNGDVPRSHGVCTDVLVRAYRELGVDLQVLVHQDMQRAWAAYPRLWQLKSPDSNIDHRRVPNLAVFFSRHGESLPIRKTPQDFLPGDIVTWRLASGLPHIGIVSNQFGPSGRPLVIHNIGQGTQLEDRLFEYVVTGHYRYAVKE